MTEADNPHTPFVLGHAIVNQVSAFKNGLANDVAQRGRCVFIDRMPVHVTDRAQVTSQALFPHQSVADRILSDENHLVED
jgi:hypothetical protein